MPYGGEMDNVCQSSQWNPLKEIDEDMPTIHEVIEQHEDTPDADAVCAWDGKLTYKQLDGWSSRLATQLADEGVEAGTFVGIYLPKSVLAVVGLMAILKAGGAFVLLHPSLPTVRLRRICQKSPVKLILFAENADGDTSVLGPTVHKVTYNDDDADDEDSEEDDEEEEAWYNEGVEPHHPLYAIYTSGSTGACICIPSEEQLHNNLVGAISQFDATWTVLTSPMATSLAPPKLVSIKTLNLAGEPVEKSDWERLSPHLTMNALYGQTESSSSLVIGKTNSRGIDQITTGYCWIVDPEDRSRLMPVGLEGELPVESTALASGYINSHDENAKTFVDMPECLHKMRPEEYKARCLLTGNVYRSFRGQRVQLGETESQLRRWFPKTNSIIVEVIQPTGSSEAQAILVAFIGRLSKSADTDGDALLAPPTGEFRAVVMSGALPTTATGKVLRKGLREGVSSLTLREILAYSQKATVAYRVPATKEDRLLQSMCAELLHLPASSLSMEENFFNIGGDPLTARRFITKAQSNGVSLAVTDVLEAPKLSELAKRMKPMEASRCAEKRSFAATLKSSMVALKTFILASN
ncbi:uncharacterized protein BDV14DRAFT_204611 [Aspergillus stella-maris]|uniref:uncharacterized protein n=1 Tax=Aspergillus stella-maris TaxID=1810926 RepID=UPI003CCD2BA3